NCLPDWSVYEGYCYKVFKERMNWADAEKFCMKQVKDGHLVSFRNSKEVDFMISLAFPMLKMELVWIGLSDYWRDCYWEWSDGAQLDYKAWDNERHCFAAKTTDNQWMRRKCSGEFYFVCKCPA
uniref:Snaclec echicetin subunit beta n=1 Tax=Echis carinatus sochureki TaxID=124223 RepID=SLB_ECHCS|nr:RecName: Full=Snaclec echicetin subunit beta [Echis carinatus sochureki]AAB32774.1 echicetin beta subunit=inhibitor of von Willebrand factor and thrombin-glycoprotein Ib binding [Echis carinatus, venom, Peptide, 123 aa] [Echis carinatus]